MGRCHTGVRSISECSIVTIVSPTDIFGFATRRMSFRDLMSRALALMDSEQYTAALPVLRSALLQNEEKNNAIVLFSIGMCYSNLCDYPAAAEHHRRAAAISSYGFENRITASIAAARAFFDMEDYGETEAQVAFSLSLIHAESHTRSTPSAVLKGHRAHVLDVSANSLRMVGRFSEALPLYEENLAYYETLGDAQKLTNCLASLGHIYFEQGLSEKALGIARRAQSLNPSSVDTLVELSELWSELELPHKALECAQKALACEEREGRRNSGYVLTQLGSAYSGLGRYNTALSWFNRAHAAYEELHSTQNINFGGLLHAMGGAYLETRNCSAALSHFTRALEIYRALLPPDHPSATDCLENIAIVNGMLGNVNAAATADAAAASTARRSQVQCAAAGCPRKVKADGSPLDQCSGCKRCFYCSKSCQTADWKAGHKAECKELRGGK